MTDHTAASTANAAVTWDAPDNGLWSLETAHYGGPTAIPFRAEMEHRFAAGFRASLAQLGVPLSHIEMRHVNGWPYASFFLHDAPRSAGKPPPAIVLKLLSRLHPGFRRRTKVAAAALAERRPHRMAATWSDERSTWIARMLELQRVDPTSLDDGALADHLGRVTAVVSDAFQRHFELIPGCIPLGLWLAAGERWALDAHDVRGAVMHSTPVHEEERHRLQQIADALGDTRPADLDAVRAHSAAAAEALDDFLEHHGGWATGDAVTATRVVDHPDVVLGSIATHRSDGRRSGEPDPTELLDRLRMQVPAGERAEFDRLAHDAHESYKMLDDNSGILGSWGAGVAAVTLRAIAERLVARGALRDADDLWAMSLDEIEGVLRGTPTRTADELAELAARWRALGDLDPPLHLNGEPTPPPDPTVFPAPVATLMTGIGAFLDDKFNDTHRTSGIGTQSVTGRAVVCSDPSDALDRIGPGDILITRATTPSYNAVLSIAGGLIVSEGGPSCHAAVVARELGLPTIVGLRDAVTTIPDGAMITLDPVKATVSVV